MIKITAMEEKIYLAFKKLKDINKVCKEVHLSNDTVRRYLKCLVSVGLMSQKEPRGNYKVVGGEYEVSNEALTPLPGPTEHFSSIQMTAFERDWMLQNYKPRKRGLAAEALGRSRLDICSMAMTLKIDVDGRWDNAKGNKSCSA